MAFDTINLTDYEQSELFGNIVFYGGNSLLKNMPETLHSKMTDLFTKKDIVNIRSPKEEERHYLDCYGGAIMSGMENFSKKYMTAA